MRRLFRLGAAAVLMMGLACHKSRAPSPDFTEASARFAKIYGQKLDDAFLDPQMADLEVLLQRVPHESSDAPDAQALLLRIRNNRERMTAEAAARDTASARARKPIADGRFVPLAVSDRSGTAAAAQDAGPSRLPTANMSLEEFQKRFGTCFQRDGAIDVTGQGLRDMYALKDLEACRIELPGFDQNVVVADGVRLVGVFPRSALKFTTPDSGAPGR